MMIKKTQLLQADYEADVAVAMNLIEQGQLVAVPTETVYGLAADAENVEAVKKIFAAKNRPANHPLIVHIASAATLSKWAKNISPVAEKLAAHFWPGPLTLLFDKHDDVNTVVTGGLSTIAIRVPEHPVLLGILKNLDIGLAAPSANPHQRISPTTAEHVMSGLSGVISAVLDGGACQFGLESTILDLTTATPRILRPGPITQKMIEDVLQITVQAPQSHAEKVSGNMKIHYSPYTDTLLIDTNDLKKYLALPEHKEKVFGIMHYSDMPEVRLHDVAQKLSVKKEIYAQEMYTALHFLDKQCVDQILIETPPQEKVWADVLDRLSKASKKYNF